MRLFLRDEEKVVQFGFFSWARSDRVMKMGEFDYNKSVILGLNSITSYRTFFFDNWRRKQDWLEEHHKKAMLLIVWIYFYQNSLFLPPYISISR